jgi:uncharacterized Zn ribbon protein
MSILDSLRHAQRGSIEREREQMNDDKLAAPESELPGQEATSYRDAGELAMRESPPPPRCAHEHTMSDGTVTVCKDCHEEVVHEPPPSAAMSEEEFSAAICEHMNESPRCSCDAIYTEALRAREAEAAARSWRKCSTHGDIDGAHQWGCPDCVHELRTENARHNEDLREAAGELLGPMPEPGTDAARVLRANRLMRRQRDDARAANAALAERVRVLTEALEPFARMAEAHEAPHATDDFPTIVRVGRLREAALALGGEEAG